MSGGILLVSGIRPGFSQLLLERPRRFIPFSAYMRHLLVMLPARFRPVDARRDAEYTAVPVRDGMRDKAAG